MIPPPPGVSKDPTVPTDARLWNDAAVTGSASSERRDIAPAAALVDDTLLTLLLCGVSASSSGFMPRRTR